LRDIFLRVLDHRHAARAIVGAGVLIRVVALVLLAHTPLDGDAGSYHETALGLLGLRPFEPHWPPGMPLLLLPAYALFGAQVVVGRAVMVLVYLAFCGAVRALARRIAADRAANLALLVFAVTPIFVWLSVNPLTHLPTAALLIGAAYFADRSREGGSGRLGVATNAGLLGLCLAGVLLTRPPNALVVGAVPVYLAWRMKPGRGRVIALAVPLAVVAILTSAWCFKAWRETGRPVFINDANSQNIWYGNNPWTPTYHTWYPGSHKPMPRAYWDRLTDINHSPDRDERFVREAMAHIRERPDLFLVRTASRVRTFFAYDTYTTSQLQTRSRVLAGATLLLDASLFMLVGVLAILFPAAVGGRDGWGALREAAGAGGEGDLAAWKADRVELFRLLGLMAFLFAVPYFVVFSSPTFHPPCTVLASMLSAPAAVVLLSRGLRATWADLTARRRLAILAGLAAFFAVQVEWTLDLLSRG
jgi:4-amino-4-deoxy-L-arabinose transferase-like glycosyltransferase